MNSTPPIRGVSRGCQTLLKSSSHRDSARPDPLNGDRSARSHDGKRLRTLPLYRRIAGILVAVGSQRTFPPTGKRTYGHSVSVSRHLSVRTRVRAQRKQCRPFPFDGRGSMSHHIGARCPFGPTKRPLMARCGGPQATTADGTLPGRLSACEAASQRANETAHTRRLLVHGHL